MKVGFVIEGLSNLKIFGPLIKETNKYGIIPFALLDRLGGGKAYDIVSPALLQQHFPELLPGNIVYYNDSSIAKIAQAQGLQGMLFINAYKKFTEPILELRALKIPTFGLDYFLNSLYTAATKDEMAKVTPCVEALTERFVLSDYFKELEVTILPSVQPYAGKFYSSGTPALDAYRYIGAGAANSLLGLPTDQKIVCLLAPNIRQHHAYYMYGLGTKFKIKRLLKTVKVFCKKNGYLLVIKTRAKQWDTPLYTRYADRVLYEVPEAVFPYTSTLLLSRSEIMVHFGSMAVLEAAAAHVPSLGISVEAIDKLHGYMHHAARKIINATLFARTSESLFNFPNVSLRLPITAAMPTLHRTMADLIAGRNHAAAYQAFNKKFITTQAYDATAKILTRIAAHR